MVIPSNIFARLELLKVMSNRQQSSLTYRLFEAEQAATTWLREVSLS